MELFVFHCIPNGFHSSTWNKIWGKREWKGGGKGGEEGGREEVGDIVFTLGIDIC